MSTINEQTKKTEPETEPNDRRRRQQPFKGLDRRAKVERLDLSDVRVALAALQTVVDELDGIECNVETGNRAVSSKKAEINRKLQYAAHIADVAKVAMGCHYHHFKGDHPSFKVLLGNHGDAESDIDEEDVS